jgi:hypothetical protein
VIVIITLGVGIGANTAIFSLVKGILLDPLPYDKPEQLVAAYSSAPGIGEEILPQSAAIHYTYEDEARLIESIGLYRGSDVTPRAAFTVILSYAYWQNQFGGDQGIIGRTIDINGRAREIIGVLPRGLRFLQRDPAVYLPYRFDRSELTVSNFVYSNIARLKEGVTIEAATADLARLVPLAVEKYPGGLTLAFLEEAQAAPLLRPLRDTIVGDVGDVLWVLAGTVGIILLIACANVANLFLVRAESRERELAVRSGAKSRDSIWWRAFCWAFWAAPSGWAWLTADCGCWWPSHPPICRAWMKCHSTRSYSPSHWASPYSRALSSDSSPSSAGAASI